MNVRAVVLAVAVPFALGACAPRDDGDAAASVTLGDRVGIVVHKDPGCGCCNDWVVHLRDNGFAVEERDTRSLYAVKEQLGVPARLHTCHTAEVGGYLVEGHVPADVVKRLVREKPADVAGLAVPGMPVGSPGMEQGSRKDPFDVLLVKADGAASVFTRYNKPAA